MINYHDTQLNKLSEAIEDLYAVEDYDTSDLFDVEKSYELIKRAIATARRLSTRPP